ncbi:class I SAM-dependent methyltransferase [Algibacter amylolyticus]|uniref:Class I SAM-dependent methyltransferase n=1 Tax=Algibacter amylolyticus TaxID=1608400 RepID=A0A5M7BLR7_9FLAO|nr:methyltransferase domain-containing protein [Algibacter amylolyticus]KAA5828111.1 class I SAM-dependent methyltransferase [Algibacter amylolyticus]MBB5267359.1 ubiquinone/menaquinone biosynthesis C-methylase UbiE [Algibacter amylolyticus]TSJ82356.1 class I SAM-dependent methyltransferase [Algibacter amylolyticus]
MEINRKKFQGVLNILSFNRHFYIYGLSVLILITLSYVVFQWSTTLYWLIVAAFGYGLLMPLIVSAYVYDFSGYYKFEWINTLNFSDSKSKQIININAGFDETSFILKNHFPISNLKVFDFYHAEQHTEPAIVRARKVSLVYPNTQQIKSGLIPLKDNSIDAIFLLSAAHEIRSHKEKVMFLKECHRVCKPDGTVIMVEHLRDFPNFLAFSIGFTHFFSKTTWKKAYKNAGFSTFSENKFTPFMSVFSSKP